MVSEMFHDDSTDFGEGFLGFSRRFQGVPGAFQGRFMGSHGRYRWNSLGSCLGSCSSISGIFKGFQKGSGAFYEVLAMAQVVSAGPGPSRGVTKT